MTTSNETYRPYTNPNNLEPEVIYTFSPIEDKEGKINFFNCLMEGKLWFAPTSTYNDIHENTMFVRHNDGDHEAVFRAEEQIKQWINSQVVKCFTLDPFNPLMWAHYADLHKGVCVGFRLENLKKIVIKEQPLRDIAVRYSSSPPLSVISNEPGSMQTFYLGLDTLMTKSNDWAYEKEHRVYHENTEMAKAGGGLINVGPDAITDVFFGQHVNQQIIDEHLPKVPKEAIVHIANIDSRGLSYNIPFRPLKSDT